jgi:mono/diheme cytochrome c family protein
MYMQKKIRDLFDFIQANPVHLVAVTYPYILVVVLGMGLFFIAHNNTMFQNKVPPKLKDTLSVIPELTVQEPRIASAVDIKTLATPTPEMISKGKQLFTTTCTSCHGFEGKGDGVAGAALNPKPRNFHATEGWKNGRKVTEIYKTLQFGIQGSGMAAFDYVSPEERVAIISYIRTFMTDAPKDSPEELAELDQTYKLSQGTKVPGQIPVAGAQKLIEKGNAVREQKIAKAVEQLQKTDSQIFVAVTYNSEKALITLVNSPRWAESKDSFRNIVKLNVSRNGFKANFNLLSDEEMNSLYNLLKGILA